MAKLAFFGGGRYAIILKRYAAPAAKGAAAHRKITDAFLFSLALFQKNSSAAWEACYGPD
jgi:hypothetical protein